MNVNMRREKNKTISKTTACEASS